MKKRHSAHGGGELRAASARQSGRLEGYRDGAEAGWRDGAFRALAAAVPPPVPRRRPIRVLYVPQGFDAIDGGVIDGLRQHVAELYTAKPEAMAEQAALIRPDLALVLNGLHVFPKDHLEQVDRIRALGIRTAVWFADDPYVTADTVAIAPRYDTVVTHEQSAVELYRSLGCRDVHHLAFAADANRFRPIAAPSGYRCDVCFIGQGFWNRIETLDAVAGELAGLRVRIAGGLWERMRHYGLLKGAIKLGWLPVDQSVLYYNGARIVLNLHRTTESGKDNRNSLGLPGLSVNPRTFEINGCGAFQLTDRRADLDRYYRPGEESETFDSPAEMMAKIRYYLEREDERRRIAARGYIRTMRDHTYPVRADRLLELLGY